MKEVVSCVRASFPGWEGALEDLKKGNDNHGVYSFCVSGNKYVAKATSNLTEMLFSQHCFYSGFGDLGIVAVYDAGPSFGVVIMEELSVIPLGDRYSEELLGGVFGLLKLIAGWGFKTIRCDDEGRNARDKAKAHFKKVLGFFSEEEKDQVLKLFELYAWQREDVLSHGDLHYGNIGLNNRRHPVIFDFGTLGYREIGYDLRYFFRSFADGVMSQKELLRAISLYSSIFGVDVFKSSVNGALVEISTNCWRLAKVKKNGGGSKEAEPYRSRVVKISELLGCAETVLT